MRRIAIIGAGAYGQQILTFIQDDSVEKFNIVGFFDDFAPVGSLVLGVPILDSISNVVKHYHNNKFDCVFIAIGYKHFDFKETVYETIKGIVPLANIISRTAYIHPTAKLGEGIIVDNFAIINQRAIIKDNVMIGLNSIINHDNVVGFHTFISTRVTTAGNVIIEKKCFIGVGTIISDDIHISDDVWLSPSSVVVKNINSPGHYMNSSIRLFPIPNAINL